MTKALEWITAAVAVAAVWYAMWTGHLASEWVTRNPTLAMWWPVAVVAIFGIYCACVITYRVATFNDCEEAAVELKREIQEARADLKKRGIKL